VNAMRIKSHGGAGGAHVVEAGASGKATHSEVRSESHVRFGESGTGNPTAFVECKMKDKADASCRNKDVFQIPLESDGELSSIAASNGGRISVRVLLPDGSKRTPTRDEMRTVKALFVNPEECVIKPGRVRGE